MICLHSRGYYPTKFPGDHFCDELIQTALDDMLYKIAADKVLASR
jgi:hypothetical protein